MQVRRLFSSPFGWRRVAITLAAVAVALLSQSHPKMVAADPPTVTGTFYANNHGIYYVQQSGSTLWWLGESASDRDAQNNVLAPNSIWHRGIDSTSVFRATITGSTATGDWVEVNRGKSLRTGTMTLAIGSVTDSLGTHVHLSLVSGTSPNSDTDWLQGDQLNDLLYVYPDGHFEVVDFYNRFQLAKKSIGPGVSSLDAGDPLGETHNPHELRPYRDQTVFYGNLETLGLSPDGTDYEAPHVNVPTPGTPNAQQFGAWSYSNFACKAVDGDLDLRVRADNTSLTTDLLSNLGWGNVNASDEGESIAPGSDSQDVLPKLTSVGPFTSGFHLGVEGIMYGGDKVQGCPSSANSLLPGWADSGGNSILVNGLPIDGAAHPENVMVTTNPLDPLNYHPFTTTYLAGLDGYPINAADEPSGIGPGTEVRVTGALILDCGHSDIDDVDTNYRITTDSFPYFAYHNCDQGEAYSDSDDQNQELHTFYSMDLIECPLGYADGYCPPDKDTARPDLTGAWGSNDGGTYYVREVGNDIWWAGLTRDRDPIMPAWTQFCFPIIGCRYFGVHDPIANPTNVFHGTITHNPDGTATITGDAITVPKGLEDGGAVTTASFTVGAKNKTMDLASSSSPAFPWPSHFDKLYEPRLDSTTMTHVQDSNNTNITGGSVPLGTAVHDSAEPEPSTCGGCIPTGPQPTGMVTYRFFTTGDCSGASSDETVDVGTKSTPQTLGLGSYSYQAGYSGDLNYSGSTSACEPFTVTKITPGLTTNTEDAAGSTINNVHPVALGAAIHDTATISGQVSGFSVDDGATVTYAFYSNNSCSGIPTTQDVTVAADGTVPGSSPQTLVPGLYSYEATYNGNNDYNAVTSACEPFIVIQPITDGQLCAFDVDPGTAGSQFKLIYTPDANAPTTSKLTADNPGQIYYSAFGTGSTGTITLSIPYPFVTQGAMTVQVYDGVTVTTLNGRTCLVPGNQIGTSSAQVALSNYAPQALGSAATVSVNFSSSTGFAYANIHLDYGLKQSTGYVKGGVIQSCNTAANDAVASTITIPDCQSYAFSQNGGSSSTQAVTSRNVFKRDPGIAGLVLNSAGTPVPQATVDIYQGTTLVAILLTDVDGWYQWPYKYTGKAATFTVKLPAYNMSQSATLKSNAFLIINFAVS